MPAAHRTLCQYISRINGRHRSPRIKIVLGMSRYTISDQEDTIRMYPALNMDEAVLREGLQIMQDAIQHVESHGHEEGDAVAFPSGVSGF